MKNVKIADFKAHLSQHLRAVRAGEVLTVVDRTTPVARVVPVDAAGDLAVSKPSAGAVPVGRVPLPRPVETTCDVVSMLLDERRRKR